jgi:hypothetical protein
LRRDARLLGFRGWRGGDRESRGWVREEEKRGGANDQLGKLCKSAQLGEEEEEEKEEEEEEAAAYEI